MKKEVLNTISLSYGIFQRTAGFFHVVLYYNILLYMNYSLKFSTKSA